MRSIVYALYIIALSLSPSLAQVPCSETVTNPAKLVNERTPGFQPVAIIVRVPVNENVEEEAKKADVTFSLEARDPQLRSDTYYRLAKILQCTFTPQPSVRKDKTYLTARMEVASEMNSKEFYYLRTGLFLPTSLLKKLPAAQTELADGTILVGEWSVVTLAVPQSKKGKRKPVMVQRKVAQLMLYAEE